MLVIRLRRIGKKNKPTYRIVVAEHSFPIGGRFVEDLGYYNPHTKKIGLNKETAKDWMDKGARPSNTVAKIMVTEKVKHKMVVVVKNKKRAKKSDKKADKPVIETAAKETTAENPKPELKNISEESAALKEKSDP